MKFFNYLLLLSAAVLSTACGSAPGRPVSGPAQSQACAGTPKTLLTPSSQTEACRKLRQEAAVATTQPVTLQAVIHPAVTDATAQLAQPRPTASSLYFDLDRAAVGEDSDGLLKAHAKYLASDPAMTVRIEGNCDERGTDAYNITLGQRRAVAVMAALKNRGVRESQMTTVSLGKGQPKHTGQGAETLGLNRRVDLVYLQ